MNCTAAGRGSYDPDTPIYDRTGLDVQMQTAKGYLNVPDYRRIEDNLQALAQVFGLRLDAGAWSVRDFPTETRIAGILEKLDAVKDAYYETPGMPATPRLPVNHYDQVNDIERAIWLLWYYWSVNANDIQYCGEIFAGDEIGVL